MTPTNQAPSVNAHTYVLSMRIDCLDKFDVDKLDDEDTIAEEELDRAILAGEFENIVDDEGEGVIAAEGS